MEALMNVTLPGLDQEEVKKDPKMRTHSTFHEPFEHPQYDPPPKELSDKERDAETRLEISFSG